MVKCDIHPALKLACAVLIVCLTATVMFSAHASSINYDMQYELAIGWLFNPSDAKNISQAVTLLNELGNFEYAKQYRFYAEAILHLQAEEIAETEQAKNILSVISNDQAFAKDLADRKLAGCDVFLAYAEGRLAEAKEDYAVAVGYYKQALVLDAFDRAIRLSPLLPTPGPGGADSKDISVPSAPEPTTDVLQALSLMRIEVAGIKKNSAILNNVAPDEIFNSHPDMLYRPEKAEFSRTDLSIHSLYLSLVYANTAAKAADVSLYLELQPSAADPARSAAETLRLPGDSSPRLLCLPLDQLFEIIRRKTGTIPSDLYAVNVYLNGALFCSTSFAVQ